MPYPNEHSARIKEPGDFAETATWKDGSKGQFRRVNGEKKYKGIQAPHPIDIIYGKLPGKNKKDDPPIVQAIRFPVKNWTAKAAQKWLDDNEIKYIKFEPAKEDTKDVNNQSAYLTTIIDDWSVEEIRQQIIDSPDKKIDLYISSNGGSVDKGFELANFIEGVNNKEIHTHILSNADSIATVIFLAPPKERRHAVASSTFMIHNPKAGIMFAELDEEAAKNLQNQLEVAKTRILNYYVRKFPNLSRDELSDFMDNDTYMTAEELQEHGAIDEVLETFDIAAYNKNYLNKNQNKMSKFSLRNKKTAINSVKLDNGDQLLYEGELAEGTELRNLGDPESLEGDHKLQDGRTIVVDKDNKITAINQAEGDQNAGDAGDSNADAGDANAGGEAGEDKDGDDEAGDGDESQDDSVKAEDLENVKVEVNEKIDNLKTELTATINSAINGLKKNISSNFKPGKNKNVQNNKNSDGSDVHEFVEQKVNEIKSERDKEPAIR